MKSLKNVIKNLIYIILCVFLFTNCDSFLSTEPADQYTVDNFWETQEQAEAGLTGVYQTLRGYSADQILYNSQITPNAVKFDNPGGWRALARGLAQTTNPLFDVAWNTNYRGIGRANTVIANVDKVDADETIKTEIKAEAKFLRAFFYLDLINKFGGVPLITAVPNLEEQGDIQRSEKSKVVSQILNDLDDAAASLPTDNDPGRATRGAALALKARVLLYEARWSEAAEAAKQVMDLNEYSLFPDYRGLFQLENEDNAEVIWDIQYKLPRFGHGFDDAVTVHNNVAPTQELANAYYMEDGKPQSESPLYDPSNPYQNRDPRLYQTIRLVGSRYNGEKVASGDVSQTGFGAKKFTTYSDSTHITEIPNGKSEINPIVIRYAEVLLTYAEAQNESVGPDPSVYDAINKIRNRPSIDMPELEPGLTQEEMRQAIRHERRIELAFEGKYLQDIKRWGIAEDEMTGPVHDLNGNIYTTRSFDPDRDYLWAIPSEQIDLNPNLEQNPHW